MKKTNLNTKVCKCVYVCKMRRGKGNIEWGIQSLISDELKTIKSNEMMGRGGGSNKEGY